MKTQPKALLLDFGGTLDSDGVHWSTIYAGAFAEAGLTVEREALDQAFLKSERDLDVLAGVADLGLRDHVLWQVRRMLQLLIERSVLVFNHWTGGVELSPLDTHQRCAPRVVDGTPEQAAERVTDRVLLPVERKLEHSRQLLQQCQSQYRMALVSNFTPNLPIILAETGLEGLVGQVYCSALVGLRKPDHAIFHLVLDELGVQPEQAAMIGDSLTNDIMPAREVGLTTLWIRGDRVFGKGDESAADHVVGCLEEALQICGQDPGSRAPVGRHESWHQ